MANEGIYNLTKPCILAFPQLDKAKPFVRNGKPVGAEKFKGQFGFTADHPDLKPLKQLALSIAKSKWPTRDFQSEIKAKTFHWPFIDGNTLADKRKAKGKTDGEWQRGLVFVTAASLFAPKLAGIENGTLVDYEGDMKAAVTNKFYPGVLVLAQFNFVPYPGVDPAPDGVTVYLNQVVTTNKGKRLVSAGGPPPSEVFKGVIGQITAEDPTAELADEITF